MKFYTRLTVIITPLLLLLASCEQYSEVYTTNESFNNFDVKMIDSDHYEIVNGEIVFEEYKYYFNSFSFDVINSGNTDAYNVEVEVTVFTKNNQEIKETVNIDALYQKEIHRVNIEKALKEDYFDDYVINVYWD